MEQITREQYLAFARKNEIPMQLLLDYYNKFNKRPELNFSLETFTALFAQFLNANSVTLQEVREYYNGVYSIISVYNKEGKFITSI